MTKSILVIDDEPAIRRSLSDILGHENYDVTVAENAIVGLKLFNEQDFNAVLCDIKMPEMDGIEALGEMQKIKPDIPVVMISGHGDIQTAVESIKLGAFNFIEKPMDLNNLLITMRNALDKSSLISETKILKKKISRKYNIIGESPAIVSVKELITKVGPTEARVLITGPNGSGKELVAHQLHEQSERHKGPFIEVNCAAIPSELIESELFGHEKGSFTSAHKQRKGKFELATDGTLFLDEIGDMSLSAQAKVLRALQENKITRVGGDKDISVNPRIVTATNKDIRAEIEASRFREDLFHRLSVILIEVPSLNERKEDIPLLAKHFIKLVCREMGVAQKKISKDALIALKNINWTGNIREFRNVIERLIILGKDTIDKEDVEKYTPKS